MQRDRGFFFFRRIAQSGWISPLLTNGTAICHSVFQENQEALPFIRALKPPGDGLSKRRRLMGCRTIIPSHFIYRLDRPRILLSRGEKEPR